MQQDLIADPFRVDVAALALSAEIRENWGNADSKHLNGVTAHSGSETAAYKLQINDLDVKTICSARCTSNKQHDDDAGRVPEVPMTAESS